MLGRILTGAVLVAALAVPASVHSQALGSSGGRIEGRFKFLPLPYLNYNRSIGLTLGAIPMAMFNPVASDTISPSSVTGLVGMYAENETWFVLGFAQLFLAEDRWRVLAAGGTGSINFQFYLDDPVGGYVPYNTGADFAFVQVQRRLIGDVFGGLNYRYINFRTSTGSSPDTAVTSLQGVGLIGSMDTRHNVYYPKQGLLTNAKYTMYPTALGNDVETSTIDLDVNHYWNVRGGRDVIAARAFAGLGIGDLSFNQQYIVGRIDIRGYTQGGYRGNTQLAVQGEYRWNPFRRWGFVAFAGLATVFESINDADNGRILPGVGVGFRFTAFTDNHMNVGMDVAVGDGDWGLYFRIGEAF
jgi:outer membrane protein assembly factor BamA